MRSNVHRADRVGGIIGQPEDGGDLLVVNVRPGPGGREAAAQLVRVQVRVGGGGGHRHLVGIGRGELEVGGVLADADAHGLAGALQPVEELGLGLVRHKDDAVVLASAIHDFHERAGEDDVLIVCLKPHASAVLDVSRAVGRGVRRQDRELRGVDLRVVVGLPHC